MVAINVYAGGGEDSEFYQGSGGIVRTSPLVGGQVIFDPLYARCALTSASPTSSKSS